MGTTGFALAKVRIFLNVDTDIANWSLNVLEEDLGPP
jgi:hypothetical protein